MNTRAVSLALLFLSPDMKRSFNFEFYVITFHKGTFQRSNNEVIPLENINNLVHCKISTWESSLNISHQETPYLQSFAPKEALKLHLQQVNSTLSHTDSFWKVHRETPPVNPMILRLLPHFFNCTNDVDQIWPDRGADWTSVGREGKLNLEYILVLISAKHWHFQDKKSLM